MTVETLTVAEAARRMRQAGLRMSPELLRDGLEQGVFPFGDHIRTHRGGDVYHVYRRLLEEWLARRSGEGPGAGR